MRKRRGYTLVELSFSISLIALVIAGACALLIGMSKSWERTTTQLSTDQNACRGIEWITQDMQEAKGFTIMSSTWIRVFFPVKNADGSYNRKITDTVNYIDYYRGTWTKPSGPGAPSASGTYMLRQVAGAAAHPVASNLTNLDFASDSPSSVDIDISVQQTFGGDTFTCAMNHRAILMRNYY